MSALIWISTKRTVIVDDTREACVEGWSAALRAGVPWTIESIYGTLTLNPFLVETIEEYTR